jgi:hypothetical protein
MYTRVSVWVYANPTIANWRWNQLFWDGVSLDVISASD